MHARTAVQSASAGRRGAAEGVAAYLLPALESAVLKSADQTQFVGRNGRLCNVFSFLLGVYWLNLALES